MVSISILILPVVQANSAEGSPLVAYAARIAGDRARTRIVIDFDRKPSFEVRYIAKTGPRSSSICPRPRLHSGRTI